MDVKKQLQQGFKLYQEINELKEAKNDLKRLVDFEPEYKNNPAYREYTKEIFKRINELLEINKNTVKLISMIDNIGMRSLLTARYINFKTWEAIADEHDVDIRWVYRVHKRAIKKLEDKING